MKEYKIKDYGYRTARLDTSNYFSGTLPKTVVNETGDWRNFTPQYEPQFGDGGFETNDCTIFGMENQIQIYLKKVFNVDVNFSERFVSNALNRDNSVGQDPQIPLEFVRRNGILKQESLPMVFNLKEYQTPRPIPQHLLDEAKKWGFDLKHEYVFANNPSKQLRQIFLREYLKYSPLGVSVTAWAQDEKGLFIDNGLPNTHWAVLVHIDDEGCMYVYDSYDLIMNGVSTALIKKLHPDHHIEVAKRIQIIRADGITEEQRLGFLAQLQKMLEWLGIIQKQVDLLPKQSPKPPVNEPLPTIPTPVTPKHNWDTFEASRRSVRVICDEEGLTYQLKNELCATVQGESNFNNNAKNINYITKLGKKLVSSTDWGIAQINDYWHIGKNKSFPSVDFVLANPETVIRWMCGEWKKGEKSKQKWIAYKSGAYKRYL